MIHRNLAGSGGGDDSQLWILGVVLVVLGSLGNNFGNNLVSLSHRMDEETEGGKIPNENKDSDEKIDTDIKNENRNNNENRDNNENSNNNSDNSNKNSQVDNIEKGITEASLLEKGNESNSTAIPIKYSYSASFYRTVGTCIRIN